MKRAIFLKLVAPMLLLAVMWKTNGPSCAACLPANYLPVTNNLTFRPTAKQNLPSASELLPESINNVTPFFFVTSSSSPSGGGGRKLDTQMRH